MTNTLSPFTYSTAVIQHDITMNWVDPTVDALKQSDIELIAYLPDSKMWPLIKAILNDEHFRTVQVTREEAAVGILSGAWLGGTRGALLCQSSGLANTFNALASLSLPARIPFLGIITRRGNLGEFNLAQVSAGYNMDRLLDDLGVRNASIENSERIGNQVHLAAQTAFSTETPYVLLLESTVTGYKEVER
jgi:sulfopyruvate decarboxylase alpha subunit